MNIRLACIGCDTTEADRGPHDYPPAYYLVPERCSLLVGAGKRRFGSGRSEPGAGLSGRSRGGTAGAVASVPAGAGRESAADGLIFLTYEEKL